MKYSMFVKRLLAAIIDHFLISVFFFVVCAFTITAMFADAFNQQMAPFVVIELLLCPISLLIRLVTTPFAYGNATVMYALCGICFITEVIYYTLFEISPMRKTPGYLCLKLQLDYNTASNYRLAYFIQKCFKGTFKIFMLCTFCCVDFQQE